MYRRYVEHRAGRQIECVPVSSSSCARVQYTGTGTIIAYSRKPNCFPMLGYYGRHLI